MWVTNAQLYRNSAQCLWARLDLCLVESTILAATPYTRINLGRTYFGPLYFSGLKSRVAVKLINVKLLKEYKTMKILKYFYSIFNP